MDYAGLLLTSRLVVFMVLHQMKCVCFSVECSKFPYKILFKERVQSVVYKYK